MRGCDNGCRCGPAKRDGISGSAKSYDRNASVNARLLDVALGVWESLHPGVVLSVFLFKYRGVSTMKRILCTLVLALSVVSLVGCGGAASSPPKAVSTTK